MFFLVDRNGASSQVDAADMLEAMREALRTGCDLHIEASPPRVMRRDDILAALDLDRPGLFDNYAADWVPPQAAEFRELLRVAKLTGSPAAALVGVNAARIRKWAGGDGAPNYAQWRLLTIYAGLAEPHTLKKALNE